jgi:gluconolactonase
MPMPMRTRVARAAAVAVMVSIGVAVPLAAQSGPAPVFREGAVLEKIFDRGINTEGPAVAPDGTVYFTDAPVSTTTPKIADRIWRWDPHTGQATIFRSPSGMAVGLAFDREGRLLATEMSYFGGRRLTRTEMTTGEAEIVAALHDGRPLGGLNDLAIDREGRVYVTEYDAIAPHEVLYQRTPGIYRIDPDGTITRIIANSGLANGIAISPDQRTLYTGVWRLDMFGSRALIAYDLAADGTASFREVLVRLPPTDGPDGMAVDTQGNLWVAVYSTTGRTGIAVYAETGQELGFMPTPEPAKNVAFGRGADADMLYVAAGRSLYRVRVLRQGFQLPEEPAA